MRRKLGFSQVTNETREHRKAKFENSLEMQSSHICRQIMRWPDYRKWSALLQQLEEKPTLVDINSPHYIHNYTQTLVKLGLMREGSINRGLLRMVAMKLGEGHIR